MFVCINLVIMCWLFVFASGCKKDSEVEFTQIETGEAVEEDAEQVEVVEDGQNIVETKEIYVFVCGEVRNPGVYKLCEGDRITHALLAAGGMTDQAADMYLNQAEMLMDGQKVYVPDKEEAEHMEAEEALIKTAIEDGKININVADKSQLMNLSGIGESRAEAIIAYREMNGAFTCVDDIKKVEGIKEGIFEKIKDKIKVE